MLRLGRLWRWACIHLTKTIMIIGGDDFDGQP